MYNIEFQEWDGNNPNLDIRVDGLAMKIKSKKRRYFIVQKSINALKTILNNELPDAKNCFKLISYSGGFASISFVCYVAENENILELTASTLRIGEKHFKYLKSLYDSGKLFKATFFIGSIMKEDEKKRDAYNYYGHFVKVCKENGWNEIVINNHSKVILMKTKNDYYVLETSSNLNDNPKIEQFSFENDKGLYDFYYNFFTSLKGGEDK